MVTYTRSLSPDESSLRSVEARKQFRAISDIVKPATREDAPSFLLEEARFYTQNDPRKSPVNILLEARPGSRLVVEGYLVADTDQLHLLKRDSSGQYNNNTLVRATNVTAYSIGDDPVTIWVALEDNVWLEVRPHVDYLEKYHECTLSAKTYYSAVDFYRKLEALEIPPNSFNEPFEIIHEFLKCHDGSGTTLREIAVHLGSSKSFFKNMIASEHGGQSNIFFRWIVAGAPVSLVGGIPISSSSIRFADILTDDKRNELHLRYHQLTAPSPPPPPPPVLARRSPPTVQDVPKRTGSGAVSSSDWKSSYYPLGITQDMKFPFTSIGVLSATILTHCAETGKKPAREHTVSYLFDRLYFGFGITWRPVARELIRVGREEILAALGPEWADSPLVDDLQKGFVSQMTTEQKHVVELARITSGEKLIVMRTPKAAHTAPVKNTAPRIARHASSRTPDVPTFSVDPAAVATTITTHIGRSAERKAREVNIRSVDTILEPKNDTAVKTSGYGRLRFEAFGL